MKPLAPSLFVSFFTVGQLSSHCSCFDFQLENKILVSLSYRKKKISNFTNNPILGFSSLPLRRGNNLVPPPLQTLDTPKSKLSNLSPLP